MKRLYCREGGYCEPFVLTGGTYRVCAKGGEIIPPAPPPVIGRSADEILRELKYVEVPA